MARSGPASTPGARASKASEQTRRSLIAATIETLKEDGFSGASARAIARRAGCNQGLVFYHFGSVANLLLAALDAVSAARLERYGAAVAAAGSPAELAGVAEGIFEEDLAAGYTTVLAELISAARSMPGFGAEVAARIQPWTAFAETAIDQTIDPMIRALVAPSDELAHGIVAMYLGLEMLSQLDGDHGKALALFGRARHLATLLGAFGVFSSKTTEEPPP
ncbi:MAG TPA: TetR family transcriptional regulator [Pseudonocardiaceae bacterium]|jgi:AcrR family transcriptional regulator|nr:TetR family transcriptional regulator [Pseudonocardiaceae bacterium]